MFVPQLALFQQQEKAGPGFQPHFYLRQATSQHLDSKEPTHRRTVSQSTFIFASGESIGSILQNCISVQVKPPSAYIAVPLDIPPIPRPVPDQQAAWPQNSNLP